MLDHMGHVLPMPNVGDVFVDVRGDDRTLRISYHAERETVVMSLWVGGDCRGTFRLFADDLDRLVRTLRTMRGDTPDCRRIA